MLATTITHAHAPNAVHISYGTHSLYHMHILGVAIDCWPFPSNSEAAELLDEGNQTSLSLSVRATPRLMRKIGGKRRMFLLRRAKSSLGFLESVL